MEQYPDHDTNLDRIVHSSVLTHEKAGDNFDVVRVSASQPPRERRIIKQSYSLPYCYSYHAIHVRLFFIFHLFFFP